MAKRTPRKELTDHINWWHAAFFNATRGLLRNMNLKYPMDPDALTEFLEALSKLEGHFNERMKQYLAELPASTPKGRVKK